MALFRKNKVVTDIPELQEYYASQKKESTAVAWLLAFGSLLVTIAILVGLFAGGRWIYRTINKDDAPKTTATVQTDTNDKKSAATDTNKTALIESGTTPTVPTTTSNIGTAVLNGTQNQAPGVSPSQSTNTNSTAVAATTSLPNTGTQVSLFVFLAVAIICYFAHRSHLLNKEQ